MGQSPDIVAARLATRQHGAFSRAQLLTRGVSNAQIRHRVARGVWVPAFARVYTLAGAPTTFEQKQMAACLAAAGAVASHRGAGALWGLADVPVRVEVSVTSDHKPRLGGVTVHRVAKLGRADLCVVRGIPCTRLPRTLVDLAGCLPPAVFETVLDEALSGRRVMIGDMERCLHRLGRSGRDGALLVCRLLAVRRAEPHPVNTAQRRLLRLIERHRIETPTSELEVVLADGRLRRLDAAWPDAHLGLEVDSFRHHASVSAQSRDLDRSAELRAIGWDLVHVTPHDIETRPLWVVAQVLLSLDAARGRWRGLAGQGSRPATACGAVDVKRRSQPDVA